MSTAHVERRELSHEYLIDMLLKIGAVRFGDFEVYGRTAPYFVDMDCIMNGRGLDALGDAYASILKSSGIDFDFVYGIGEKGKAIATATAIRLHANGKDTGVFFVREDAPREYDRLSWIPKEERQKMYIIGQVPRKGEGIAWTDDQFVRAEKKYEAKEQLEWVLDSPNFVGLLIALDRQEIGPDGRDPIGKFTADTKIRVYSVATANDIYRHMKTEVKVKKWMAKKEKKFRNEAENLEWHRERMRRYIKKYGTKEAKSGLKMLRWKR